jgi:hypothetical protein
MHLQQIAPAHGNKISVPAARSAAGRLPFRTRPLVCQFAAPPAQRRPAGGEEGFLILLRALALSAAASEGAYSATIIGEGPHRVVLERKSGV